MYRAGFAEFTRGTQGLEDVCVDSKSGQPFSHMLKTGTRSCEIWVSKPDDLKCDTSSVRNSECILAIKGFCTRHFYAIQSLSS